MFKNKYREIRSGWAILLLILIQFSGMFLGLFPAAVITCVFSRHQFVQLYAQTISDWSLCIVISVLAILAMKLLYNRPLTQFGLNTKGMVLQTIAGILLGTFAISLPFLILMATNSLKIVSINWHIAASGLFINGFLSYVSIGIWEELLWRSFAMTSLKTTRNIWAIIGVSSLIFAGLHFNKDSSTLLSTLNLALFGTVVALLFVKTGRVWISIGFHIEWNFVQDNVFGVAVSGNASSSSIFQTKLMGADWWTGANYGFEGGVAATIILLLFALVVYFIIKTDTRFWRVDSNMPLTRGISSRE